MVVKVDQVRLMSPKRSFMEVKRRDELLSVLGDFVSETDFTDHCRKRQQCKHNPRWRFLVQTKSQTPPFFPFVNKSTGTFKHFISWKTCHRARAL